MARLITDLKSTSEFASCFISSNCTLNGRKVMAWILIYGEKIKI